MNSGSPPNKTTPKDPATVYTPSSAQKRFNPFMKDMGKTNDDNSSTTLEHKLQTSPIHKKPLTPTNEHPLKDLERNKKAPKSEFLDSSDEKESIDDDRGDEKVDAEKEIDAKEDTALTNDTHIIDNDVDVVKRTKKATTNNNNNNVKNNNNNNRMSYPMGKSQLNKSQQRLDDSLSKSTDKLDGEWLLCRFEL